MKIMMILILALVSLSTFANSPTFTCAFEYHILGKTFYDEVSSKGQQSTKVEGFLARISSSLVVREIPETVLEKHYYVSLLRAMPGIGLITLESVVITEKQVENYNDLYTSVVKSGKEEIKISCIKD